MNTSLSDVSLNSLLHHWLEVLRCPLCHARLRAENIPRQELICEACAARYPVVDAIPALIIPEQRDPVAAFCEKYDALRLQEGWASETPDYYRNLPFRDLTGLHPHEWQLRVTSFRLVQKWLERNFKSERLRILDVGAGSCWMSRELAANHDVLAIDANAGPHGLAALPVAQRHFMAVQAELERLPIADHAFDLAIANASLHYTNKVEAVLGKISCLLRPGGKLIVMDSPAYATRAAAATATAHDRTRAYYAQMGVPELAVNYGGLLNSVFLQQQHFQFTCLRRDFTKILLLKKWWRELNGEPAAARFPIWLGEHRILPGGKDQRAGAALVRLLFTIASYLTYAFSHETQSWISTKSLSRRERDLG